MVDWRCRESEGKAKIEGYMSISDEEAHQCRTDFEAINDTYIIGLDPGINSISEEARNDYQAHKEGVLW